MNSTQTAYAFGQHGSALVNDHTYPLWAPQGLVIVAISMLVNTKFTRLIAEDKSTPLVGSAGMGGASTTHLNRGKEYIGSSVAAHDLGDCVIAGASKPINSTTVTHTANVFGIGGGSAIKVGMQVVGLLGTLDWPRNGVDGKPVIIKEILSTTTFRVSDNAYAAALPAQSLAGLEAHSSAYGGQILTSSQVFPAGLTIFGRWTYINTSYGDGECIVYFGV